MSVFFTPDPKEWSRFTQAPSGDVQKNMRERAMRVRRYARRQVGKDTHKLVRSIDVTVHVGRYGTEWWVGSNNRIALLHHEGTRPHIIRPKKSRVLRMSQNGKIVYAREVQHPGTKPNRYLTDNLRRAVD